MAIRTARLDLIPATAEKLRAELKGRSQLQALLGAQVPDTWPPEFYGAGAIDYTIDRLTRDGEPPEWWFHYFVRRATPDESAVAIGAGGYKGPPRDGSVEIGYSVLPEYRRRGYASEATAGLVTRAFDDPGVQRVIAHTLPELIPSIGVLEKCGFRYVGAGPEDGSVRYEVSRFRLQGVDRTN